MVMLIFLFSWNQVIKTFMREQKFSNVHILDIIKQDFNEIVLHVVKNVLYVIKSGGYVWHSAIYLLGLKLLICAKA